jgi:hypothetical protein
VTRRSIALRLTSVFVAAIAFGWTTAPAQSPAVSFRVREGTGIQRTQYPIGVRIPLQKGRLTDLAQARLMSNGAEVPAQLTSTSSWDDGSVQTVDVDFNASLEAEEERRYQLQLGIAPTAVPAQSPARGLVVDEQPETIQVGPWKFSKNGSPLLASVAYRGEGVAPGRNGLVVTDSAGKRHDLTTARAPKMDVLKRGPLLVVLRYSATLPIDDAYSVLVELLIEVPNSKSWVKMTATVRDGSRRLRDLALETPLAFDAFPWLWDFGTDSGTYGVFRGTSDAVVLTQSTASSAGASRWTIATTSQQQRRTYETSAGSRAKVAGGWGHFQDGKSAVAFGVEGFGKTAGTHTISLDGRGQTSFRVAPGEPTTLHQMTLYEHFVPTPVAVGAATNPTSMLNPPVVVLDR